MRNIETSGVNHGFTGTYKEVPITILCTGVGYQTLDFTVRELCLSLPQETAIVLRLGKCVSLSEQLRYGDIVVCTEFARMIQTNYDVLL